MLPVTSLPAHGRIPCAVCHEGKPFAFDRTITGRDGWRITDNPMAWGSTTPIVVVLGFSKGPTQVGALSTQPHDTVPYRGGRKRLAQILHHVGLLASPMADAVDQVIGDRSGIFHFGSLVRCTVERHDDLTGTWSGTGGGMLDRFVATPFGAEVTANCATRFLGRLPDTVRIVIMLGLGSKLGYVQACRRVWEATRPGAWRSVNEVSYTDGRIVVVHTEHFRSQGSLISDWLAERKHERGEYGLMARHAVAHALSF